jgi:integrase
MGTVFKKQVTRPLPDGAEIIIRKGERLARWKDRRGKARTALLTAGRDGAERIVTESPFFIAKYRDGAGLVREVATGCRDETAARQMLADLERKAELVKAGVMTTAENAVSGHQETALAEHFAAYVEALAARGTTRKYQVDCRLYLDRLARECALSRLADIDRTTLECWIGQQAKAGKSARTRNAYQEALVAFCNWCVQTRRLAHNPLDGMTWANVKADPRRQRRAMTEPELMSLLLVARERPLLDVLTIRRGTRKGAAVANVRPEVRARLEWIGRERALIYKTLVLTGLRKGELASLTVAKLDLDADPPFAELDAADEKNREGNTIPLRPDLAADLREWLADQLGRMQQEALRNGFPVPARLPPDMRVFYVPRWLYKILNRDLRLAGIPKRDERGRTLDVHALRTTFGTLLSKGGVAPRTAQAAMRHSDIRLTMGVYTDPKLLDVGAALDVLPALPLNTDATAEALKATGTHDAAARMVAPAVAPTTDSRSTKLSFPVKSAADSADKGDSGSPNVTPTAVSNNAPLSAGDNGRSMKRLAPGLGWLPDVKSARPGRVSSCYRHRHPRRGSKRAARPTRVGRGVRIVRISWCVPVPAVSAPCPRGPAGRCAGPG